MTDKEPNEGLNTSPRSLLTESNPQQENSASTPLDMLQIQQDLIAAFRLQAAEMMEEVRLVKEDILNHNAKTKRQSEPNEVESLQASRALTGNSSKKPEVTPNNSSRRILQAADDTDNEDQLSIAASENDFENNDIELDLDDLDAYDASDIQDAQDLDDGLEDPAFRDLLESVESTFGPPMEEKLASVMHKIWGQAKITDTWKKTFKEILIPKNAKFLQTPELNPEVENVLYDGSINKDKGHKRRQRLASKATVPLMSAFSAVRSTKAKLLKISKDKTRSAEHALAKSTYKTLSSISPMLRTAIKCMNASFSDALRKRKSDICHALGKQYGGFSKGESTYKALFDDATLKKMKPFLKITAEKLARSEYSKNYRAPQKSWRGGRGRRGRGRGRGNRERGSRNHRRRSHNQNYGLYNED